ncbi:MAG: shikimate kinase, shikimate kinase [Candidatus Peregrinibacteria bacterium GW2011_GWF2_43_17]|nr:MAG: shikimate kinase, shikimate kinase [Candidatus Peregrinibacteria bacterium GW2011_GWF2_43_17]
MRGSGKTAIGQMIAKKLRRDFIDLDVYIERTVNKKIIKIVEEKGWNHFRELEEQAVDNLSKTKNAVISTGGGTFINPANAKKLKKNGLVLLLTADLKTLEKRINFSRKRPPLTSQKSLKKELEQIWKERKKTYLKNADFVYDNSSDKDPEEKAEEILEMLPV